MELGEMFDGVEWDICQTDDTVTIQAKAILRPWPVNRSRGCYQILMALYNLKNYLL